MKPLEQEINRYVTIMNYLCTQCGHINSNETLVCSKCDYQINLSEYEALRDYARVSVYYGYQYRNEYEAQVSKSGKIITRYSLIEPEVWYEWLAIAALGGIIGNYATDLVKYIGKQITDSLKEKIESNSLNKEEKNIINFLSDNRQINKLILYINGYYDEMPKVNEKVREAILEEIHADEVSSTLLEKFDFDSGKNIKGHKQIEKPSIEATIELFKTLKKEWKVETKKCIEGHIYHTNNKECPHCIANRKVSQNADVYGDVLLEIFPPAKYKRTTDLADLIFQYGYIFYKASTFLLTGANEYRYNDFFHYPLVEWDEAKLKNGCEQWVNAKGITEQQCLENLTKNEIRDLFELFHYSVIREEPVKKRVSKIRQLFFFKNQGEEVSKITIQHMVSEKKCYIFCKIEN